LKKTLMLDIAGQRAAAAAAFAFAKISISMECNMEAPISYKLFWFWFLVFFLDSRFFSILVISPVVHMSATSDTRDLSNTGHTPPPPACHQPSEKAEKPTEMVSVGFFLSEKRVGTSFAFYPF
jgi:hypothetical protein